MKSQLARIDIRSIVAGWIITLFVFVSAAASTPASAGILAEMPGTYVMTSTENYDAYLVAVGVTAVSRKMASSMLPVVTISVDGEAWTIKTESSVKSSEINFKLGETFSQTTFDGRVVKTTVTLEDGQLVEVDKGDQDATIRRAFSGSQMIETLTAGGVAATRIYTKK